jgi:hypothetical protein
MFTLECVELHDHEMELMEGQYSTGVSVRSMTTTHAKTNIEQSKARKDLPLGIYVGCNGFFPRVWRGAFETIPLRACCSGAT